MARDNEEEERRRLEAERARMSPEDRLYGKGKRRNADGFIDGRSDRRTGRVFKLLLRVHPRVRAIIGAIKKRDGHPSFVVLLEEMVEAYQKVHGEVAASEVESEEEIIARFLKERDKRDGE